MNITKTELPTRPFKVKKFKLECDDNTYYLIQDQFWYYIQATMGEWVKATSCFFISNNFTLPSNERMINLWHDEHPTPKKYKPHVYDDRPGTIDPSKVINVMPKMIREDFPNDVGDGVFKPTLLQRIKNLFKKKWEDGRRTNQKTGELESPMYETDEFNEKYNLGLITINEQRNRMGLAPIYEPNILKTNIEIKPTLLQRIKNLFKKKL